MKIGRFLWKQIKPTRIGFVGLLKTEGLDLILLKIEIKNRVYLKIFSQNQLKKFEVLPPTQFMEVENCVKIIKKVIITL
jgi:hypothetical protein